MERVLDWAIGHIYLFATLGLMAWTALMVWLMTRCPCELRCPFVRPSPPPDLPQRRPTLVRPEARDSAKTTFYRVQTSAQDDED
jgi:hypothetical protein